MKSIIYPQARYYQRISIQFAAIVAIFTLGTWINRKNKSLCGHDETRPLLREDNPEERDTSSHAEARYARNRAYIHSRVLERFSFLLEIWYWLLIYWVCDDSGWGVLR